MVETQIADNLLRIHVRGAHQLWALKSEIDVPIAAIRRVSADPARARHAQGWRSPGTSIPGLLNAGTFYEGVHRVFWDVHNSDNAIVIEIDSSGSLISSGDRYDELIVEVADPAESVAQITRAIAALSGRTAISPPQT